MPEIEIRPATTADLQLLVNLEHSYETEYVWQMDRLIEERKISINFREIRLPRAVRVEYPRSPNKLEQEWSPRYTILVAAKDESQVGYIRINCDTVPNSAWVTDLVISEGYRRQGIASALTLAAQEWVTQHGCKRLILEMQSKNYPAIQMAQKLGYEFCGYNDHYYANQDIVLFFARFIR